MHAGRRTLLTYHHACNFRLLRSQRASKADLRNFNTNVGSGYESIGSFHSENIQDLMSRSVEDYVPPDLPFEPILSSNDFMVDKANWSFLNHGAFGGALHCGHTIAQQWRAHLEEQPLRFFDRELLPHLVYAARRIAHFCNGDRNGIALSQNVTSLLNTVIAGYVREYKQSAKVVLWDISYGSVKKMANVYCDQVIEIPFQSKFLSQLNEVDEVEEVFLEALEGTLNTQDDWNNALLILDHTTSNTALNLPIEVISKRAKEAGMIVVVDGAHGLLAQEVDFTKLPSVDIYVSNGHKWLCCPRGIAMMYCPHETIRETILRQPAILSHGVDDGYLSRFMWDGCRDYAAQLALPTVLDFWEKAHPPLVRSWLRSKLTNGIFILVDLWHNNCDMDSWPGNVTLGPLSIQSPMALVKLPRHICGTSDHPKTAAHAKHVQDFLFFHGIEVPVKCINGILFVRLSCHIYNELREYDKLGQTMLVYPIV